MCNVQCSVRGIRSIVLLVLILAGLAQVHAQPTITQTVPTTGTFGVSPSAPVVFTFSTPMNPTLTSAQFMSYASFPPASLSATAAWSSDALTLTCTPSPAFPASTMIIWLVDGESAAGDALESAGGAFTTGAGGGGGENCTNLVSSFTVAKGALFEQTSSAAPTPNPDAPFAVVTCTTLACSNLDATSVSVRLPASTIENVPATTIPGHFSRTTIETSSGAMDGTYPNGDYLFTVQTGSGALPFTVNFPGILVTPNAPQLTNYVAAQAIDATKPFVLGWNPFTNGTPADWIYVELYGGVFNSGDFGTAGALDGTARSITIPANTLAAGSNYSGAITFYDIVCLTNSPNGYITLAYRGATTEFSLATLDSTPATPLLLTNAVYTGSVFSFDVTSAPGRTVIVESRTNLAAGQWSPVLTTNSASGKVHITDPRAGTNWSLFYRAR